jgi:hypothetical protein
VQQHDFRAVHQTLPAIGGQVRLGGAPTAERRRPLLRPAQVEHLLTGLDHRAIYDAGDHRRHLVRSDRDHHLVQGRDAVGDLAHGDQRLAGTEPAEGLEIGIPVALAGIGDNAGGGKGTGKVAGAKEFEPDRYQQIALLDAFRPAAVEQPPGPGEPAVC